MEALLRRSFRPEFLNRLDEIVFYKPLTKADITSIIDLLVAGLNKRLADKELTCVAHPGGQGLCGGQRLRSPVTAPGRCAGSCKARWKPS